MPTLGGYITPIKPKTPPRPGLATVMGGAGGYGQDPFGLAGRDSGGLGGLFPQQPSAFRAAAPQTQTQTVKPTQAPATAPTVNTSFQTGQTQGGGPAAYSIETDPALQQVYAYAGRADADATAQALADKTRLVEQAGLPDLVAALGLSNDVRQVAATNPFSSAANLKHQSDQNARQLDLSNTQNRRDFNEQANQANLLYSGYRNRELARLADAFANAQAENTRGYQQGLADLTGGVQGQAAQIGSALAAALNANVLQRIQAEQAARDRAAAAAMQTGFAPNGVDPSAPVADANVGTGDLLSAILSSDASAARRRGQRGDALGLFS